MNVLLYLLLTLVLIYLLDYAMVFTYCGLMSMRQKRKDATKKVNEHNSTNAASVKITLWGGVKSRIFNLADGWLRYSIMHLGRIPCHWYRDFILRHIYRVDMGERAIIYGGFEIRSPWRVHIGRGSVVGDNAILDGRNGLYIGENVNFSTGVNIWTEQHDMNDPMFACNDKGGCVTIGDRAWVSTRTIILPGVTVGEGAVVAAGAVVTKDCEDYSVYGGVPAKKIGERSRDLRYNFKGQYMPFY